MPQVYNKRRFPRYDFREALQYRITDRHVLRDRGLRGASGTLSCDLSIGGVRFWTDDFIPIRTPLEMKITFSSGKLLTVNGQVAWVQKLAHGEYFHVGVSFAEEDPGFPRELLTKSLRRFSVDSAA